MFICLFGSVTAAYAEEVAPPEQDVHLNEQVYAAITLAHRVCRKNSDCEIISYSCSERAAANKKFVVEATKAVCSTTNVFCDWLKCNPPWHTQKYPVAACAQNQCVVKWHKLLPPAARPSYPAGVTP
jgi:hypothetical protein